MTLRALGHPVHSMLVHLPLGLLFGGTLWQAAALWRPELEPVARWSVIGGLAGALIAAVFGLVDWANLGDDETVQRLGNRHLVAMTLALIPFALAVWLHDRLGALGTLASELAGSALLGFGAWHGAELVYGHGVGTRRP